MDQQLQKSKLAAVHNTTQLDSRLVCALERQLQKRENFWISLFMCQLLTTIGNSNVNPIKKAKESIDNTK